MKVLLRVIVAIALIVLVLLFLCGISPRFGVLILRLPFAWLGYVQRTLPNVSLNWSGIGMVAVCSALTLALGHALCRWFYRQITSTPGPRTDWPAAWPMRWTIGLYAGFWLLFAIVIAASGLGRTTTWFFQSGQPLYRARPSYYVDMRMLEAQLATAQLDMSNNLHEIRAAILTNAYGPIGWEDYEILWFEGPGETLHAAIYYPRNPEGQRRVGFRVFGAESSREEYTMDQLPEFISRLEKTSRELRNP